MSSSNSKSSTFPKDERSPHHRSNQGSPFTSPSQKKGNVTTYKYEPGLPNSAYVNSSTLAYHQRNSAIPREIIVIDDSTSEGSDNDVIFIGNDSDNDFYEESDDDIVFIDRRIVIEDPAEPSSSKNVSLTTSDFRFNCEVDSTVEANSSGEDAVKQLIDSMPVDGRHCSNFQPPKDLKVTLLPHQIEGVCWMINREDSATKGGLLADGKLF